MENIKKFISSQIEQGRSREYIENILIAKGWSKDSVKIAFDKIFTEVPAPENVKDNYVEVIENVEPIKAVEVIAESASNAVVSETFMVDEEDNRIPLGYKLVCVALVFFTIVTFVYLTQLFSGAIQVFRLSQAISVKGFENDDTSSVMGIFNNGFEDLNSENSLDTAIYDLSVFRDRKSLEEALKENTRLKKNIEKVISNYNGAERTPFISYQLNLLTARLGLYEKRTEFYKFGIQDFKNYEIEDGQFSCKVHRVCEEFDLQIKGLNESRERVLEFKGDKNKILDASVLSLLSDAFYMDLENSR